MNKRILSLSYGHTLSNKGSPTRQSQDMEVQLCLVLVAKEQAWGSWVGKGKGKRSVTSHPHCRPILRCRT